MTSYENEFDDEPSFNGQMLSKFALARNKGYHT